MFNVSYFHNTFIEKAQSIPTPLSKCMDFHVLTLFTLLLENEHLRVNCEKVPIDCTKN